MSSIDASIRAALETHLCALTLATTGPRADIAATHSGYSRASGSFLDDGFQVGDTVQPQGFAANTAALVLAVSNTVLVVDDAIKAEAAGPTVSLTTVLPARRKFEGQPFLKPKDQPWLRAALKPAGAPLVAWGTGGLLRHSGSFLVELFEPVDNGRGRARIERLAAALRSHFRAGQAVSHNATRVRLTNAQRAAIQESLEALSLLVTIDWACEAAN
jgi:hypothetical protein